MIGAQVQVRAEDRVAVEAVRFLIQIAADLLVGFLRFVLHRLVGGLHGRVDRLDWIDGYGFDQVAALLLHVAQPLLVLRLELAGRLEVLHGVVVQLQIEAVVEGEAGVELLQTILDELSEMLELKQLLKERLHRRRPGLDEQLIIELDSFARRKS